MTLELNHGEQIRYDHFIEQQMRISLFIPQGVERWYFEIECTALGIIAEVHDRVTGNSDTICQL